MLSGVPMSLWIKTWKLCTPLHIRKSTSMVLLGMLIYLFWGRLYGVTPSLHLMLYTVFCWSTEYGVKSSRIHKGIQHHSIHFDPWKTTISSTTQVTFLWYLWFPKGVLYIYIYYIYIFIIYIYLLYILYIHPIVMTVMSKHMILGETWSIKDAQSCGPGELVKHLEATRIF